MVVNINAQISNYKERVVGNYTLRQVICLILALMVGTSTYFYLDFQKDIKQFVIIFTILPIIAVGFYTYQGVTCEKFIYYMMREFLLPQKRPFVPDWETAVNNIEYKEGVSGAEEISENNRKRKVKNL